MKRLLGIILALASTRAGADALGDMKAAMERLSAKQPVRATFSTEATVKSAGRFANDNSARAVSTEVTHDAAGVSIAIPQALIEKASQEAKVNGDGENKAQNLIGSIRTIAVVEALDFRAPLLVMLHNATVAEEQRVAFRGRPARMLTLKLNPRTGKESGVIRIGTLKTDDHMKLWIGDDNLPVAAERIEKKTGGVHVCPRYIHQPIELHLRAHARPFHPCARGDERQRLGDGTEGRTERRADSDVALMERGQGTRYDSALMCIPAPTEPNNNRSPLSK